MNRIITHISGQREKAMCQPRPLKSLFTKHPYVLVGDELGAFYLDHWATLNQECRETTLQEDQNPYYPWNRRSLREACISYMELVHAAYEQGVKDVVIDMAPAMQPGINEALRLHGIATLEKDPELVFLALLASKIATPMDAVVEMAGSLGMRVHAVNDGLSGIATFLREAKGHEALPPTPILDERCRLYMEAGFHDDVKTLANILRRKPTDHEIELIRGPLLLRLSGKRSLTIEKVLEETPTATTIRHILDERPFLGFFQNERLFSSEKDLDAELRSLYGQDSIARVCLHAPNGRIFAKHPHYTFHYALKACHIAMTREQAKKEVERLFVPKNYHPKENGMEGNQAIIKTLSTPRHTT